MAAAIAKAACLLGQAPHYHRRFGLGRRQHLEGHVGRHRQGPPGAGKALGEIVAGDVLDHAPARFEGFAASRYGMDAENMVARGAGLDAPGSGQVGRQRAADRAATGFAAG
jgi:hypothetical protein